MTENSSGEPSGKSPDKPSAGPDSTYLSRRRFLKGIGVLATSAVLGGCGPGQSPVPPDTPSGPATPPAEAPLPTEGAIPPELASYGQETISAQAILSPQSEAPQELKENRLKTRGDGSENPPNFITDHGFQTDPEDIHRFTIYWPRLSCYIARYGLPQDGEITTALNDRDRYTPEYLAFCEVMAFYRTLVSENLIGANETIRNIAVYVFADADQRTTNFPARKWGGLASMFGPVVKFSFVDGRSTMIEELSHDLIKNEYQPLPEPIEVPYGEASFRVGATYGWDILLDDGGSIENFIIDPDTGTPSRQKSFSETINMRMYRFVEAKMEERYEVQFIDDVRPRELGTVTAVFSLFQVTPENLIRISLGYRENVVLSLAQFLGGKCENINFSTENLTADEQGKARMVKGLAVIRAIVENNQSLIQQLSL